jgi:ribosome modulation factor
MSKQSTDSFLQRGYDDFEKGVDVKDCPYKDWSNARKWRQGWWNAQSDAKDPT